MAEGVALRLLLLSTGVLTLRKRRRVEKKSVEKKSVARAAASLFAGAASHESGVSRSKARTHVLRRPFASQQRSRWSSGRAARPARRMVLLEEK